MTGNDWQKFYQQAIDFHKKGQYSSAEKYYRHALDLNPEFAKGYLNLGVLYFQLEQYSQALQCFKQASLNEPSLVEAFFYAGNAARCLQQMDDAIVWYQKALSLKPDYADAFYNLGTLYKSTGRLNSAISQLERAIAYHPDHAMAWNNLGICRLEQDRPDKAFQCFLHAGAASPDSVEVHYNMALCRKLQGRADEALHLVEGALQRQSDHGPALALQVSLLQQQCDWDRLAIADETLETVTCSQLDGGLQPAESPFLSFTRSENPKRNLEIARAWSLSVNRRFDGGTFNHPNADSKRLSGADHSLVTIGYLSEQFRDAATSHLMAGLFECHDRQRFKVIAYSLGKDDGSVYRRRIESGVDRFVDIRDLSIQQAVHRIQSDGVDILVDLIGWMHGHRIGIPALRPAPIQVNYLGFPGTSGADFMDYILADATVIPPDHQRFYSEKVVYLPHCYQATDPDPPVSADMVTRESCGLPENAMVFASFNTDYKIESRAFKAWMAILNSVPHSVLWLLVRTQTAQSNLLREAEKCGIDPQRLVFAQALPKDRHLARLRLADVALDTFTVNGHTTTSDALWAGVPVVTMIGGHFASRVAASILSAAGLPMLITHCLEEYVRLAVQLAHQPDLLSDIKARLGLNKETCPLFDIRRFVSNLESAYMTMWQRYVNDLPPESIIVEE